jgi:hypothetical protein
MTTKVVRKHGVNALAKLFGRSWNSFTNAMWGHIKGEEE